MAAVAPLIEYHRRDLLHSRGVVPFERHLVTQNQKPPPLVVADQRALATLFAVQIMVGLARIASGTGPWKVLREPPEMKRKGE